MASSAVFVRIISYISLKLVVIIDQIAALLAISKHAAT